jgi:flagellar basal-body rod protein FlgB
MWDELFASTDLLHKGLQASWLRNAVLRNNLANSETPNFKSSDVKFESIFARALESGAFTGKRTNDRHIEIGASTFSSVSPQIVQNDLTSMRFDGNNVDAEAENVKLAQNTIRYNTLIYKLNSELNRIKTAVTEGK